MDPSLLAAWLWLVLKVFGRLERYSQTLSAVFGTGALLGLVIYLPLQMLVTGLGFEPTSGVAQAVSLALVVVFALVTGRIVKLATDSSLFTGIAVSLTYFFVINTPVGVVVGTGS